MSSLLEKRTGVHVKDCFRDEDETWYVIVSPGELGKAVGKEGSMVKRLQEEIGKKIRVIEFRENVVEFIRNIIYPLQIAEVIEEGEFLVLKDNNKKTKSLLIGRQGRNINILNRAVKRFFPIKEVKVE